MTRTAASGKPATKKTAPKRAAAKKSAEPRLSPLRKPAQLSAEDWQRHLRRQFGREQAFEMQNLGEDAVFSDFAVLNPASRSRWRVTIRGTRAGDNTCTCPDYASNELGTCKHIEFTLSKLAARRGGKAALARGYSPAFSEVYLHHGAQRTVRWRAGSDCPADLLKLAAQLFDLPAGGELPWMRLAAFDAFTTFARTHAEVHGHEVRLQEEALAFVAQIRDAERRGRVLAEAYPEGPADAGLGALLATTLYPYQAEGALFAARVGRVLLADEMGLGKTVQAIAAAELLARHFGVQRVLVVCPTSLKHQWQRELQRFAGRDAQVLQGLRPARAQQYREDSFCKITTFETVARDLDLINAWAPDLLIIDEAQRVKNWNTIAARALRRVSTAHALVLTGTPLENRLEELIAIVQLVDQHRLGPTWRLLHEHQQVDDSGRVVGYQRLDQIGATLAPIMLRRRKAEVLTQLPARMDKTLFVPLTPEQRLHHDENGAVVTRIVSRWRKSGFLSDSDQRRLQCALQNMRMACDSTWLLDHETDFGAKADELVTLLAELFEQPDAKAVVFSQWLGTHEVVMRRLRERGWGHVLFHGGVPGDQRGALVDRFISDPACRLFLSTDAGGVGLNLQHAAATVVNMDLPWNPAVLEQRIGRVYRLGQQRGVQVVNLVAQGSIEEGMLSVLAFKQSLFAGVLDAGASDVFMQGTRLAQFMKSVDAVTGSVGNPEPAGEASDQTLEVPDRETPDLSEVTQDTAPPQPLQPPLLQSPTPPAAPAPELRDAAPTASPAPVVALADPWAPLLAAGLQLIESLRSPATSGAAGMIETDPNTGLSILKVPLPQPDTLRQLAEALASLLGKRA